MLNSVSPGNGINVFCLLKHLWSQCQPTECGQEFFFKGKLKCF